jgi:hypothetical protein
MGNTGGGFRNQQNGIPLNRNHVFDSSGPEMRVRGTAQQLYEKYQQLARDAFSNGDRVTGEAYYQHAEHYFRIVSAINQAQNPQAHAGQGHAGQNAAGHHQMNGQQPHQNFSSPGQGRERNGYHPSEPQNRPVEAGANDSQEIQFGDGEARSASRAPEPRWQEPRRNDFVRNDRGGERPERRREMPMVDPRFDISSALEAELAAAAEGRPLTPETEKESHQPVLEARSIPIASHAPPAAPHAEAEAPVVEESASETAETTEKPAKAASPRPRGRPRLNKAAPKEA